MHVAAAGYSVWHTIHMTLIYHDLMFISSTYMFEHFSCHVSAFSYLKVMPDSRRHEKTA